MRSNKGLNSDENVLLTLSDTGYYEFFLEYKQECELLISTPISFTTFYNCKPWNIISTQKVETCVCVYHREMVLYMKAMAVARKQTHPLPNSEESGSEEDTLCGNCSYSRSCPCECIACSTKVTYLTEFMDTIMCPRAQDSRLYKLKCVLGLCKKCGWEKCQAICDRDGQVLDVPVTVRLLQPTLVPTAGKMKSLKVETPVTLPFGEFKENLKEVTKSFKTHDFVARWQAGQYLDQLKNLRHGHEIWVADYIENFKTFTKVELQQDYYNKTQITVFIVMVVRWRLPHEIFSEAEVSVLVSTCTQSHIIIRNMKTKTNCLNNLFCMY